MKEWSKVMIERMKELKPLVACFNGKGGGGRRGCGVGGEGVVWEERVWCGRRGCDVGGEGVVWEERVWCGRRGCGVGGEGVGGEGVVWCGRVVCVCVILICRQRIVHVFDIREERVWCGR